MKGCVLLFFPPSVDGACSDMPEPKRKPGQSNRDLLHDARALPPRFLVRDILKLTPQTKKEHPKSNLTVTSTTTTATTTTVLLKRGHMWV